MITLTDLFVTTLLLAYSNGANDNFKRRCYPLRQRGWSIGIALITREANRRVVSGILMSWVLTLPISAILSAVIYAAVRTF